MELPTYTNIWRIEKRLYKLYDFRLPMPVPVGQVAAFLAIAVPYVLILTLAGMPFSHSWLWIYVLPPGVIAWLVTRPVLEGKRLPELALSQLRYLREPRTWCRMAPLFEKEQITLVAKVWRRPVAAPVPAAVAEATVAAPVPAAVAEAAVSAAASQSASPALPAVAPAVSAAASQSASPALPAVAPAVATLPTTAPADVAAADSAGPAMRPAWPTRPAVGGPGVVQIRATAVAAPAQRQPAQVPPAQRQPAQVPPAQRQPAQSLPAQSQPAQSLPAQSQPAQSQPGQPQPGQPQPERARSAAGPALTVRTDSTASRPLPVVERALRSSPSTRAAGWHDRVVVVPGGHRPGKPDQVQRDQARVRLPLPGPARIVVLGCTAGAGQTLTTLMTGQLLASLRGEAVAVLDLSPRPGSLTERARDVPRLFPSRTPAALDGSDHGPDGSRERGLQVVTADVTAEQPEDPGRLIDAVVARYRLTLADPAAAHVPRALHVADQLVLVVPASSDAAGSLATTLEWLQAHDHAELVRSGIIVLNGVSDRTGQHVDQAAAIAKGRCLAVVRVPWDGRIASGSALGTAAVQAYTALAGVLVSALVQPLAPGVRR